MSSRTSLFALPAFALLALASTAAAEPRTFVVDSKGGSRIQFVSDAPLETTTGVTSDLSGTIELDLAAPSKTKAKLKSKVDTLRTGSDLRDEHLAGDGWLDAKKCPNAEFQITEVTGIDAMEPLQVYDATVKGKFTIHCVTREITARAKVRFVPQSRETKEALVRGDVLKVKATFMLQLENFKVSVPSIVRLKVSNDIKVNVSLRATAK